VHFALAREHPKREFLREVIRQGRLAAEAERVRSILDETGARRFLVWAALFERERALDSLKRCPGLVGREALRAYANMFFADLDGLLGCGPDVASEPAPDA